MRHGESECNKNKVWTGWIDSPLTEKGKEDARIASKRLSHVSFDKIYASDLVRAVETARIVAEGAECEVSELLREVNVGNISGKSLSILTDEEKKKISEIGYTIFDGESQEHFKSRVVSFMERLENEKYENVAIFTHAGWLRTFLDVVMGFKIPRSKLTCANCAIAIFEFSNGSWNVNSWMNLT